MAGSDERREATELVASLKACARNRDILKGTRVHAAIVKRRLLKEDIYAGNALLNMYAKCGEFARAREVLDELHVRNVITWTALIGGYAHHGHGAKALKCYEEMQSEGVSSNAFTLSCILKACGSTGAAHKGEKIHAKIVREQWLPKNMVLCSALVDMYAKCGELAKAQQVLDGLPVRDVISWTGLIAGYTDHGHSALAVGCLERMQFEGFLPNEVTFSCILRACGHLGATERGKEIHARIIGEDLLQKDIILGNALVDFYATCGLLPKARQVFDELCAQDVVTWTALICGYVERGQAEEALKCYEKMQKDGISPDTVTLTCVLMACGCLGASDRGEMIHAEIVRAGLLAKSIVLGNALVDMYAKCGAFVKAQEVFDKLSNRNVVSWNALIAGYTQHGHGERALKCFDSMQSRGVYPDMITYACVLKACGCIGAICKGRKVHAKLVKERFLEKDHVLCNALVDMYAKCGALLKAQEVFDELPVQDVVSWTSLIAGYTLHGHGEDAFKCFERMQSKGFDPDPVTYTCMVDLFGRAGQFDKVRQVIKKMPPSHDLALWFSLLSSCHKWGNVELGRLAFECAIKLDERPVVAYTCMRDIYAAAGMQEGASHIDALRMKMEAWKKTGRCWLRDFKGEVHSFCVGDESPTQIEKVHAKLEAIAHKISQKGYCPYIHLT